jgi:uncharacterized protein (UPF0276 family)
MRLAVNYSPAVTALLREGRVQVDYLKCPPWPDLVEAAKAVWPVTVHCDLRACGDLSGVKWGEVERLLAGTETRYVSIHLGAMPADFPDMAADACGQSDVARILDRTLSDVRAIVARFGAERVVVENIPYFGPSGCFCLPTTLPSVISQVVAEAGCGLLLDVAHAIVSSHNQGIPALEYIGRLPMHRLRELHFHGTADLENGMQDHLPAVAADWGILDWLLGELKGKRWPMPWLMSYEYGGTSGWFADHCDQEVLAEQVPALYEGVRALT